MPPLSISRPLKGPSYGQHQRPFSGNSGQPQTVGLRCTCHTTHVWRLVKPKSSGSMASSQLRGWFVSTLPPSVSALPPPLPTQLGPSGVISANLDLCRLCFSKSAAFLASQISGRKLFLFTSYPFSSLLGWLSHGLALLIITLSFLHLQSHPPLFLSLQWTHTSRSPSPEEGGPHPSALFSLWAAYYMLFFSFLSHKCFRTIQCFLM